MRSQDPKRNCDQMICDCDDQRTQFSAPNSHFTDTWWYGHSYHRLLHSYALGFVLNFTNRGCTVKTKCKSGSSDLVIGSLQTPSLNSMPACTDQNCAGRLFCGLRKYDPSTRSVRNSIFLFIIGERFETACGYMTKINSLAYKTIVLSVLFAYLLRKKKKISGRRKWVTDWLLQRECLSHVNLLAELKFGKTDWFTFLRMDEETYWKLLDQVSPLIQKHRTEAVSPHKK